LAKKEHPDRHRLQHHETQHSTATHISFSDITAAYKTLSDDTMRRIYDNELDAEAARRRYASWSCVHFVYDLYTFYLQNYSCIAMCMPCVAVIEDCL
jgi:curved DNA-binding protein CbpA